MSNQIQHYIIWDTKHPNGNHKQIRLLILKSTLLYSSNGPNNGEHCEGYVPEFKNKYFCIYEHNWILLIMLIYWHALHSGCFFSWNETIFCPSNILKCHLWHTWKLLLLAYLHSNNSDMLNTLLLYHVLKDSINTGFTLQWVSSNKK